MASTHEEVSTSIIKADRLGRTHYSSEYKAQVLEAFETSSLSGAAFAHQCGVSGQQSPFEGGQEFEDFPQVVFHRNFKAMAVLHDGVDHGGVMPGIFGSKKEPILHAQFCSRCS